MIVNSIITIVETGHTKQQLASKLIAQLLPAISYKHYLNYYSLPHELTYWSAKNHLGHTHDNVISCYMTTLICSKFWSLQHQSIHFSFLLFALFFM